MSNSTYVVYADGELHEVQAPKPESFRSGLYIYARRHDINAKSYIKWNTLPYPTVVFRLGKGELEELPNVPPRGSKAHGQDHSGGLVL